MSIDTEHPLYALLTGDTSDDTDTAYVYTVDDDQPIPVDKYIQHALEHGIDEEDTKVIDDALSPYQDELQRIQDRIAREQYLRKRQLYLLQRDEARFYEEYHVDPDILAEAEAYRPILPYNYYKDHRYS